MGAEKYCPNSVQLHKKTAAQFKGKSYKKFDFMSTKQEGVIKESCSTKGKEKSKINAVQRVQNKRDTAAPR